MTSLIVQPPNAHHASTRTCSNSLTDMPTRRVLGDLSPNVKAVASPGLHKNHKPIMSSPLKRSMDVSIDDRVGFTYLKRRRLSDMTLEVPPTTTRSIFEARAASRQEEARDESPPQQALCTSPTEPDTTSEDEQCTQTSSKSFSSLINYDPSSQTSKTGMTSTSRAEMLKLRLRVAMFKVRTGQVQLPFDQLHIDDEQSKREAKQRAIEEAVAELRREAQEKLAKQTRPVPQLLPAPVLLPTTYSSRFIYQPDPTNSAQRERVGAGEFGSRSSPSRHTPEKTGRRNLHDEQELTSSVVKGRCAEGLLGLRNAA